MEGLHTRALIIDDNPAIHEDMRKILISDKAYEALQDLEADLFGEEPGARRPQYRIDSAFQGREGLAKVREALSAGDLYACGLRRCAYATKYFPARLQLALIKQLMRLWR